MTKLTDIYRTVAERFRAALTAAGYPGTILSEDTGSPIIRPSAKLDLDDSTRTRLLASGAETSLTFRLYFFARDRSHPARENLAVRQALGDTFLDGLTVGGNYLGIDEGLRFSDGDGVLEAAFDVTWAEPLPDKDEESAELMENLIYR